MKSVDRVATIVWKSGACALTALLVVLGSAASAATLLSPAPAFNGRVVRLEHASRPEERQWLVATALVPAGGMHANVYLADRDGAPFRQIGEITDPEFGSGLCCGALYELPQQVGSLRGVRCSGRRRSGRKPSAWRPGSIAATMRAAVGAI